MINDVVFAYLLQIEQCFTALSLVYVQFLAA